MLGKRETYDLLDKKQIDYTVFEHEPVFTIDQMMALGLPHGEKVVKNLFLRDDKGQRHYLVVMAGHKTANLKSLAEKIPSRRLNFASDERLDKFLGLKKGGVTPLGILNNMDHDVILVIDDDLKEQDLVGIHPMENTATIFLSFDSLIKLLEEEGNAIVFCPI